MDELSPLIHETLSESAYTTLAEALTQGRFQPGQRLKIRDLATQLGTSVTPVRDAILRLVQDEALSFRSARDIRIPGLSLPEYLEIRAIRLALEGLAAAAAAARATTDDLAGLEALLARHEAAMQAVNWRDGLKANQEFHFRLAAIARMPILAAQLRRLWLRMGPMIAQTYIEGGRAMIEHHYPVLAALQARNPEAASRAIQRDITEGGQAILAFVSAQPSKTPAQQDRGERTCLT